MRLDPNPLFRRVIAPWYDSNLACWILLVAMLLIALFSVTGVVVACQNPDFHSRVWVPLSMLVLCLFVLLSVGLRLLRRYTARGIQDKEPEDHPTSW